MSILKRNIFPFDDWQSFLVESKKEFDQLVAHRDNDNCKQADFELIMTIGKGAFGRVYMARQFSTGSYYAIKVLDKARMVKTKQVKHAINEKRILQALNFPFCIHLVYGFMDNSYLYFVLPFVSGGEMFSLLRKMNRFQEPLAKFYGAQILLALEYLHYCSLIFRDLKPENVLIDHHGYVKLTDFGFCKLIKGRTYTLCGTPEYLAPEIILNKGYGPPVDWWTYGILLYEMTAGYTPFHANDPMQIFDKIVLGKLIVPNYFSLSLTDIINNIIQLDLSRRYGNLKNGVNDIKEHAWFSDVNWLSICNGKVEPPYFPTIEGPGDCSNFDKYREVTLQTAKNDIYQDEFKEF